jgi:orotidine-5'-phosphate decarboxylase
MTDTTNVRPLTGLRLARAQRAAAAAQDHLRVLADIVLTEMGSSMRSEDIGGVTVRFEKAAAEAIEVPFPTPGTIVVVGPEPDFPCIALYRDPPGVCEPCPALP